MYLKIYHSNLRIRPISHFITSLGSFPFLQSLNHTAGQPNSIITFKSFFHSSYEIGNPTFQAYAPTCSSWAWLGNNRNPYMCGFSSQLGPQQWSRTFFFAVGQLFIFLRNRYVATFLHIPPLPSLFNRWPHALMHQKCEATACFCCLCTVVTCSTYRCYACSQSAIHYHYYLAPLSLSLYLELFATTYVFYLFLFLIFKVFHKLLGAQKLFFCNTSIFSTFSMKHFQQ